MHVCRLTLLSTVDVTLIGISEEIHNVLGREEEKDGKSVQVYLMTQYCSFEIYSFLFSLADFTENISAQNAGVPR